LRAGVIAAGWGERLRHGEHRLKPLVPVAGRTLVERVLTSLAEAAPSEVVIIVNEESGAVKDHVSAKTWPFRLRWIVETTPSSMHSFLRVVETLASEGAAGSPFLISTVDTIAAPGAFAEFADLSRALESDVTLAVTPPSDDEKPLLVRVGSEGCLTPLRPHALRALKVDAIGKAAAGAPYATAGYYSVRPSILREADQARRDNLTALRLFLERLLARGYEFAAIPVAAGVDVDRPGDVRAAETFLKQVGA
jgi:NDP-sugar pyrophosphorylase family protein